MTNKQRFLNGELFSYTSITAHCAYSYKNDVLYMNHLSVDKQRTLLNKTIEGFVEAKDINENDVLVTRFIVHECFEVLLTYDVMDFDLAVNERWTKITQKQRIMEG